MTTVDEPTRPPAFAALLRSRNLAADDALVAALPRMEYARQVLALEVLLARDHDAALAGVAALYGSGDDALDVLLSTHAERLSAGARQCMSDGKFETRRAAVELIRASESGRLAYLLAEALKQPCRKTAQIAADALSLLAEGAVDGAPETASSRSAHTRGALAYLVAALQNALASWPLHFRPEVVVAAARHAGDLEATILTEADDPRSNVARAFNNAVSGSRDPRFAGYCLRALRSTPLRAAAAKMLNENRDPDFRSALVAEAWLLVDDDIRRSCSRVRKLACLRDDVEALAEASAGRGRAAVRLIGATGGRSSAKLSLLRKLAICAHLETARAAMWALIDQNTEESTDLLRGLCARRDVPLRNIGLLELQRRTNPRKPVRAGPMPTFVPVAAEANNTVNAFEPYWNAFDTLPAASRNDIGRNVADGVPDFASLLRAKWTQGGSEEKLRALRIIQTLDLATSFEEQVYEAARDEANVIRSLAMSLLGTLDRAAGRRLLRAALDDPDDRVQANAIEALERLGAGEATARVVEKLESPTSRVRANAVKALMHLGVREGARTLVDMLGSEVASDRFSALWVIERMQLQRMMARIERLVESDPDLRVRTRARRVLRTLGDKRLMAVATGASGQGNASRKVRR